VNTYRVANPPQQWPETLRGEFRVTPTGHDRDYGLGEEFEHEFADAAEEQANLASGIVEIVPREYRVLINGIDLSDHVTKVTTEDMRDQVDITAMGASNKVYGKGLGDGKITIEFLQDFAAGKVHATLQPLISTSTTFSVEIRPVNGARSATNPAVLMTALMFNYSAVDAGIGDALKISADFVNAAQTGITYPTV
jgi:hypothetical protein